MTEQEPNYVPATVKAFMDDLEKATGVPATAAPHGPRRWRITHTNDRVTLTLDYKTTGPGRWHWAASTLTVDGQRRALAAGMEHYAAIFADPDKAPGGSTGDTEEEQHLPAPPSQAPPPVRKAHRIIADALAAVDHTVETGHLPAGDVWLVELTTGRVTVRMRWTHTSRRKSRQGYSWDMAADRPIEVVVDGVDRTGEVGRDINKALHMAANPGGSAPAPDGRGPVSGVADAARSTAVETRRATVIRV